MKNLFSRYKFYAVTLIGFILWVAIIDNSSIKNQLVLWQQCRDFEETIDYFKSELENVKKEKAELLGNDEAMETFAREKYWMKKKDEVVFVLVDEEDQPLEK